MEIEFKKSDDLIGFLCMCADVLNNPFDEEKVTVTELLLSQLQGYVIPVDIPENHPNKRLLDDIRNNPVPDVSEIKAEFYGKAHSLSDITPLFRMLSAKWNKKISRPELDLSMMYAVKDEKTERLYSISANMYAILHGIELMLTEISIEAGLNAPDIYKEDVVKNITDELNKKDKNIKLDFADLLIYESIDILMAKLRELLANKTGVDVVAIVKALEKLKLLKPYSSVSQLHSLMTKEFGSIGGLKNFTNYINGYSGYVVQSSKINQYTEQITTVILFAKE